MLEGAPSLTMVIKIRFEQLVEQWRVSVTLVAIEYLSGVNSR